MEIAISRLNTSSRKVRATFTQGGLTHTREVNACIREDGTHDVDATRARIAEVAAGVAEKFALGLLSTVEAPTGSDGV